MTAPAFTFIGAEHPRVLRIVRATVHCATCAWSAIMTGDTEAEVETFLRGVLLDHTARLHPPTRPS